MSMPKFYVCACTGAWVLFLLSGCDEIHDDYFGAAVVAERLAVAHSLCAQAGVPDIQACAFLGAEHKDARTAARLLQESYEVFKNSCYESAGMSKCETMLREAIERPTTRR